MSWGNNGKKLAFVSEERLPIAATDIATTFKVENNVTRVGLSFKQPRLNAEGSKARGQRRKKPS